MATTTTQLPELWMILKDRQKLAKLMVIQGVSARQLSDVAGWKSHTYLQRLLRGDVKSLKPEPALRIANHLGVGVDDLFLTKVASDTGRSVAGARQTVSARKSA